MAHALPSDLLAIVLCSTDRWFARLACRTFRDACEPARPHERWLAQSIERLTLAHPYVPRNALHWAILDGREAVIRWFGVDAVRAWELWSQRPGLACDLAALGGHLGLLRFLRADGFDWGPDTAEHAAQHADCEMLRWACSQGCPWGATTQGAARKGHVHILEWARAAGCPWSEGTYGAAVAYGHVEVLKWLWAAGCPGAQIMMPRAALHGQIGVLDWMQTVPALRLHNDDNDRVYDFESNAAMRGHVSVLEWLRTQGVKSNVGLVRHIAARRGNVDVLEWAEAHDRKESAREVDVSEVFTGPRRLRGVVAVAAMHGNIKAMCWLIEHGYTWSPDICRAAACWSLDHTSCECYGCLGRFWTDRCTNVRGCTEVVEWLADKDA